MKLTSTHTTKKISLRVVASAVCAHVSISDYKNRCPVIFEQKTTQKPLPGGLLENQNRPALRPGFDHFLSYFSSVQKEKSVFWTIFSGILGTPPWPLKNRFFDHFKTNLINMYLDLGRCRTSEGGDETTPLRGAATRMGTLTSLSKSSFYYYNYFFIILCTSFNN